MIRIIVVDDHTVVRTGICRLIETAAGLEVVAEGGGGHEAVRLCRELEPDVLVLDYGLPDLDGLETTQQVLRLDKPPKILILTMHASEEYATRLIRAGAKGFVIKTAPVEQVLEAIRTVARGQRYVSPTVMEKMLGRLANPTSDTPESVLSDREVQVLIRLAQGMTTREVAGQLNLSVSTVDTYRRRILEKLDLRNNADMTRFAIQRKLIHLE
jgi:two-component system, NarL family, invasion response regulator UvrY